MTRAFLAIAVMLWGLTCGARPGAAAVGWLAYGDLRGHIEPCGCDPATDMGGIKRLVAVIGRERTLNGDLGVFALGNDVPPPGMHGVKAPFLLEADALVAPTAMLLNVLELRQLDLLRSFAKAQPQAARKLNLVLTNARDKTGASELAVPAVESRRFIVLGYARSPEVDALVQPLSPALLKSWRDRLARATDRHKVLLFSGGTDELETIAGTGLFDTIIASNASPLATEPGVEERRNEELLRRVVKPAVYAVPLGGQGILRGGSAMFDEAKPLAAYLAAGNDGKQEPASDGSPFRVAKLVTWLSPDVGETDATKRLFTRYEDAVRAAFVSAGAERAKDLAESPYAGSEACATCHVEAMKVYKESKHAHAMATLVGKDKQQDAECVGCHSVGSSVKGGFVSLELSPGLANVQCENCHGPRKAHSQNPQVAAGGSSPTPTSAREVCVSCHNRQHSPAFAADTYWQRIQHR